MKRGESTRRKLSQKAKHRVGEKNSFYDRKHSAETIELIRIKKLGTKNEKKYKPLIATNIETGEKLYFKSRLEAAEEHGFRRGGICEVLRGKYKQYKGYTFSEGNRET